MDGVAASVAGPLMPSPDIEWTSTVSEYNVAHPTVQTALNLTLLAPTASVSTQATAMRLP